MSDSGRASAAGVLREATVFGAGAVGSLVAARLAGAGVRVRLVARGAQGDAIRRGGLALVDARGPRKHAVELVDDCEGCGPQACVIVCLKAHTIAAAAPEIAALCGPETALVPILNGVPWWYGYGDVGGGPIASVDPDGSLWRTLPPGGVVGSVTHVAAEVSEPGTVRHVAGERFVFGEPDGSQSPRLGAVTTLFERAGFESVATRRIRQEIWLKLLGNTSFNPVSVLTGATMDVLCADARTRAVLARMMAEGAEVARALGVEVGVGVEERLRMAESLGAFKTSMLQDVDRGRSLELEALVGAVVELGEAAGLDLPVTKAVYALARSRAEGLGLYAG